MNDIIKGQDGKYIFTGKEDPRAQTNTKMEGSKMECPVCHGMFDYLVGEDTPDGGRQGCEGCWKPSNTRKEGNAEIESQDPKKMVFK